MIILKILLTIWLTCSILNTILMAPVLFNSELHKEINRELVARYPQEKPISRLNLFMVGIIAAPMLSYQLLFGENV